MPTLSPALLALAVALAPVASLSAQGNVWVVAAAPGPGVDATSVDAALALAADGDLILVRGGASAFAPFTVDGIAVTIQRDPSVGPVVIGPGTGAPAVTIRNLAAGRAVTLNGLEIRQAPGPIPALHVHAAAGAVVLDAVAVHPQGGTGALVVDCASVAFEACLLGGGKLPPDGVAAETAALDALRSSVYLDTSIASGANGTDALASGPGTSAPGDGASAVRLRAARLTLTAGEIAGGAGGNVVVGCDPGGAGGAGIVLDADQGVGSFLRRNEGLVGGGPGGHAFTGCSAAGEKGDAIALLAGAVQELPQAVRYLIPAALVGSGDPLELTLIGQVGDAVFLVAGLAPAPGAFLPGLGLTAHVAPAAILALGSLAEPSETRALAVPALPPGAGFAGFTVQALYLGAGELFLTGPNGVVIVP